MVKGQGLRLRKKKNCIYLETSPPASCFYEQFVKKLHRKMDKKIQFFGGLLPSHFLDPFPNRYCHLLIPLRKKFNVTLKAKHLG